MQGFILLQVYLCSWRETAVAAKLLLEADANDEADIVVAAGRVLDADSQMLASLRTVRSY